MQGQLHNAFQTRRKFISRVNVLPFMKQVFVANLLHAKLHF